MRFIKYRNFFTYTADSSVWFYTKMYHRSRTSTGVSDQASLLQMFATCLVPVNSFPHTSHFISRLQISFSTRSNMIRIASTYFPIHSSLGRRPERRRLVCEENLFGNCTIVRFLLWTHFQMYFTIWDKYVLQIHF